MFFLQKSVNVEFTKPIDFQFLIPVEINDLLFTERKVRIFNISDTLHHWLVPFLLPDVSTYYSQFLYTLLEIEDRQVPPFQNSNYAYSLIVPDNFVFQKLHKNINSNMTERLFSISINKKLGFFGICRACMRIYSTSWHFLYTHVLLSRKKNIDYNIPK